MPPTPQLPDFDPFEVLGVTRDDPPEAVKAAWRQAAKEHHPDAVGGSDEQIKRINVAYEWLRDPTLRDTWLAAAEASRSAGPRWAAAPTWPPQTAWSPEPAWPLDPDEPPPGTIYEGPRAHSIDALADHIAASSMDDLLDLVHRHRPDPRWSIGLARAVEASGRRTPGAAAVWQVRQAVRSRLEELLSDARLRAVYDDELVGQVVSDRLADVVRGIVLLDLLTSDARARVTTEWDAIMGAATDPPGDDPAIGARRGRGGPWSRVPEAARWLVLLLGAALYSTALVALLPSQEAFAFILLGIGAVAVMLDRNRRAIR